jgi:hypothetical protein
MGRENRSAKYAVSNPPDLQSLLRERFSISNQFQPKHYALGCINHRCINQCCGSGMIFFGSGSDFSQSFGSDPGSDSGSDSGSGSCMKTYTHTQISTHIHTYTHYTHTHTQTQTYTNTHKYTHAHTHYCLYVTVI